MYNMGIENNSNKSRYEVCVQGFLFRRYHTVEAKSEEQAKSLIQNNIYNDVSHFDKHIVSCKKVVDKPHTFC